MHTSFKNIILVLHQRSTFAQSLKVQLHLAPLKVKMFTFGFAPYEVEWDVRPSVVHAYNIILVLHQRSTFAQSLKVQLHLAPLKVKMFTFGFAPYEVEWDVRPSVVHAYNIILVLHQRSTFAQGLKVQLHLAPEV